MTSTESWRGRFALMVAHCAGMVDLVALPVWVGTLVARYGFDPQQAGGLVTAFLAGAVGSSLFFAPRFNRIRPSRAAMAGFGLSGLAFLGMALTADYGLMLFLHGVAGVAVGCGLSFTHGTIGRSARPHRLFAIVSTALGVFAILFFAFTPKLVATMGGAALFWVFGTVMLLATAVAAVAFPEPERTEADLAVKSSPPPRLAPAVWLGALGMSCLALMNSTTYSFVERIGMDRGFGLEAVAGVLVVLGIVNLFPAPLAAVLERRLPARAVVMTGPVIYAALALVVTHSTDFLPYAIAVCLLPSVLIFVHTFAFGLLARLDPSGRAVAATPAMVMVGAALGPVLGGTVVKFSGYASLGITVALIAPVALLCFAQTRRGGVPGAVPASGH